MFIQLTGCDGNKVYVNVNSIVSFYWDPRLEETAILMVGGDSLFVVEQPYAIIAIVNQQL